MFKEKLCISVIVPAYNAEKTIAKCLKAILSSDYKPFEVIVVDDASDDRTRDIAREYGVKLVTMEKNQGQGAVRNIGSKMARGNILVFIDSDIIVSGNTLQIIVTYFRSNPRISAITGTLSKIHLNTDFFSQYKNLYMNAIFKRLPKVVDFVYGSIFAVKSKDFLFFSDKRNLGEDTELGLKMTRANKKIHLIQKLEVVHLKKYSMKSLLKNDFYVPFHFAKIFINNSAYISLFKKRRFSHTSGKQIICTLISPLIPLCLVLIAWNWLNWILLAILLSILACLNLDIFKEYLSEKGTRFTIAAVTFTFLDMIVMSYGVLCGVLYTLIGCEGVLGRIRRKVKR